MVGSAFALRDIPEKSRLDYWHEAICQTYLTVNCEKLTDDTLDGAIRACTLGSLELSEVASPAMTYSRGNDEIQKSREEFFQLVLAIDGQGIVEQCGRQTEFMPGDMVIYTSLEQSKVIYPHGSETQVLKIPVSILEDRLSSVDSIGATLLNGSTPMGTMARSVMREWMSVSLSDQQTGIRVSNGALDILITAIEGSLLTATNQKFTKQLSQVKRYIEDHISDPDLDVHQIARANNVSVRTLNRMFAADGTTAIKWIWCRRLATSHKVLSEGRVRPEFHASP